MMTLPPYEDEGPVILNKTDAETLVLLVTALGDLTLITSTGNLQNLIKAAAEAIANRISDRTKP